MAMLFFERDIALDLGTTDTLLYVRGKGVAVREPTVVAVDKTDGRLLKVGEDARKMLGRTPVNIAAVHPIVYGVISDYDMTTRMLQDLMSRVTSFSFFKPRVLVCVPGSITGVEERAVIDSLIEAGARKVFLIESAIAAATGAGVDISKPDGHMVIDIGGGTTEIAVVSLGGVVENESIKIAGDAFDDAIIRYVRKKYNVLIGAATAEEIKREIGTVFDNGDGAVRECKGRSIVSGLPQSITITRADMVEAFAEPMEKILEAVYMVLERTPPELVADISVNGIVLTGGGSQVKGIDGLITSKTGIEATVVDDPVACVVYGAGKLLRNLDEMPDGMINLARRKQLN